MADKSVPFRRWNLNKPTLVILLAGSAGISPAHSDNLVLQGSTTFTTGIAHPHASAVEAQTGQHLEIIPNNSNLGLLALFEHKADLAMISTPLPREIEILSK